MRRKIDKLDFIEVKDFGVTHKYHQENGKTTYRIGENIDKYLW